MPLLSLILSLAASTPPSAAYHVPTPPVAAVESLTLRGEESFSKLRKVHLVRPDLIAYPLFVETVC